MAESVNNPYDINGQHFNSDMYFQKLLKVSLLKYKYLNKYFKESVKK